VDSSIGNPPKMATGYLLEWFAIAKPLYFE